MSQPAVSALAPLPFELVYEDGEPLETDWHTREFPLLRDLIRQTMVEQGRTDYFAGANIFVYYSVEQAREVYEEETKGLKQRAFRGPDVFWVGGVDPDRKRKSWIAWEEDGRLPDVIVELLSPSTASKDRNEKKALYAQVFRTAEYFLYEPETGKLEGWRLVDRAYRAIQPDERGRLWSGQLGVFLGLWHGVVLDQENDWLRLFRPNGSLIPTQEELTKAADRRAEASDQRAEAERQRAEAERQRAETAEAELARLRALLEEHRQG